MLETQDPIQFRLIEKTLLTNKIEFVQITRRSYHQSYSKGYSNGYIPEELKSELELLNFNIKLVKRFGPENKPMPICLVILNNDQYSKKTYELNDIFYLKISVKSYKPKGPSQFLVCQRFGHSTLNCSHDLHCVKYSGQHKSGDCLKTREQDPTCCNCGVTHTANYRGCPYYVHVKSTQTRTPSKSATTEPPLQKTPTLIHSMNYAKATKNSLQVDLGKIMPLLTDLLTTITTTEDPKEILFVTIKSFIKHLSNEYVKFKNSELEFQRNTKMIQ